MFQKIVMRAVLAFFLVRSVHAHTWVEQLNVIAPNGTMTGTPGFARGNVKRSDPGFGDTAMVNLIPPNGGTVNIIDSSQLMCKQEQNTPTQASDSPRLTAVAGASVALRYQENGHVTLPQNQAGKPSNRGTNFVYYTTESQSTDKFLEIHRVWSTDGTGGDGRGRLISTQNFDDGQCYQVNGGSISTTRQGEFKHTANALMGADLWCQQDIQIPTDAKAGSTITLYWVWDWPTMPGTEGFPEGKQEIYTTCMDIDIVAATSGTNKAASQGFVQQDFANAAVAGQFKDISNPTAVSSPAAIPFAAVSGSGSSSSAANAATVKTSAAAGSTIVTVTALTGVSTSTASATQSNPLPNVQGATGSTVTVVETATTTVTRAVSPTSANVVTKTETAMVTVVVTNTLLNKRSLHTASPDSSSTPAPCSKAEAAYRLRARAPFYVLPSSVRPSVDC